LFGSEHLPHLSADHASHLVPRIPEGLFQTDGVIHGLNDGGIPIFSIEVVKDTVASHPERLCKTRGERGTDRACLLRTRARQGTVGQTALTGCSLPRMRASIVHMEAECGGAGIHKECPHLEDRDGLGVVEARHVYKIIEQREEICVQAQQFLDFGDLGILGLERGILSNECRDILLGRPREQCSEACAPQCFHLHASLGSGPGLVRRQLRFQLLPRLIRKCGAIRSEQRRNGVTLEANQSLCPIRIDALQERQVTSCSDG